MFAAYAAGLVLGFGLITPIGAQNLFVVGQGIAAGLPRALWAVAAAGFCDTLLITLGAAGVSGLLGSFPVVRTALLAAGAVFLGYLGAQALRACGDRIDGGQPAGNSVRQIVARTASVSLLNPHAILDTVGVIGTAVAAQASHSRFLFAVGTVTASWLWFLLLAAGAAQFRHYLTGQAAIWFDRISGVIMLGFATAFTAEFIKAITR